MEDTATPVILQVVIKLPYRYGNTEAERRDSFMLARVQAFASRALLDKSFDTVALGAPVCGLLDTTAPDYKSAQLVS